MPTSERECFVALMLPGGTEFVIAGRFRWIPGDGAPVGRFVYGRSYLERRDAVEIDPVQLRLSDRVVETGRLTGFFGAIRDAMPDDWGRRVLERRLGGGALSEFDYLEHSPDDRAGALGFAPEPSPPSAGGRFLRLSQLARIQRAADAIVAGRPTPSAHEETEALLLLSTSMGGARPKTQVLYGVHGHAQDRESRFPRGGRWMQCSGRYGLIRRGRERIRPGADPGIAGGIVRGEDLDPAFRNRSQPILASAHLRATASRSASSPPANNPGGRTTSPPPNNSTGRSGSGSLSTPNIGSFNAPATALPPRFAETSALSDPPPDCCLSNGRKTARSTEAAIRRASGLVPEPVTIRRAGPRGRGHVPEAPSECSGRAPALVGPDNDETHSGVCRGRAERTKPALCGDSLSLEREGILASLPRPGVVRMSRSVVEEYDGTSVHFLRFHERAAHAEPSPTHQGVRTEVPRSVRTPRVGSAGRDVRASIPPGWTSCASGATGETILPSAPHHQGARSHAALTRHHFVHEMVHFVPETPLVRSNCAAQKSSLAALVPSTLRAAPRRGDRGRPGQR